MSKVGSDRPPPGDESLVGQVGAVSLGKYRLFATLGRGGMADVYLAVSQGQLGFNKLLVVKRLRSALAEDPAFLAMFLDEARLASRLNHPNVVHTYEVGEASGAYFIAMEYLEGQPLNRVLRDLAKHGEELDEAMCARIVADALAGLHYAHTLRDYDGTPLEIVHRDVSPHNIFVTYDGQVKLVDFGIAKAVTSTSVTEVGVLKGKVAYMAPEQAQGARIDARADIFGMGAVLWELLALDRLIQAETAAAAIHRLLNQPIPSITTARDVDSGLAAIVARALEKDASRRYQTAEEMRDALEDWLRTSGHKVRDSDIGARILAMYADVREDVHRQVQEQMASVAKISTREIASRATGLTVRAARLPEIKVGSGTGSGVAPRPPMHSDHETEPRRRGALFFLGTILVALIGIGVLLSRIVSLPAAPHASASFSAQSSMPSSDSTASQLASPPSFGAADPAPSASATTPTATSVAARASAPTATLRVAASASAPAQDAPGFLTFDTYPWTRVSDGARLLGTTPLIKVPLAPGAHTLSLENPEQGIKKTYAVRIKSGETFSMRLGLAP
jgi:serine/threonine-protein kinase